MADNYLEINNINTSILPKTKGVKVLFSLIVSTLRATDQMPDFLERSERNLPEATPAAACGKEDP